MKKIKCNVIRDILPLYADEVVSQDTKVLVEEHLRTCPDCKKELSELTKDLSLPIFQDLPQKETSILKNLKKQLKRKKILISLISVFTTILLLCGIYTFLILYQWEVPFEQETIEIQVSQGKVYAVYKGKHLSDAHFITPYTTQINGEKKKISTFCFYESLWSTYVEPLFSRSDSSEGALYYELGDASTLEEIYYGNLDLHNHDSVINLHENFSEEASKLKLEKIWENETN